MSRVPGTDGSQWREQRARVEQRRAGRVGGTRHVRELHYVGGGSGSWRDPRNWSREKDGAPLERLHVRGRDLLVISGSGTVDLRGMPCAGVTLQEFSGTVRMPNGTRYAFAPRRRRLPRLRLPSLRLPGLPSAPAMPAVHAQVRIPVWLRKQFARDGRSWQDAVRMGTCRAVLVGASLIVIPLVGGGVSTWFWVGGAGTWDNSSTTHWATTSGGAGGAGVPATGDSVVFDENSGNVTITTAAGLTVQPASVTLGIVTAGSNQPTLSLGAAFTCTGTLNFGRANLTTNNFALTVGSFSSSSSTTRTLTLGSSAITATSSGTPFLASTTSGLTVTANTATLTLTGGGAGGSADCNFGNFNWNGLSIVFSSGVGAGTLRGVFTCANLTHTGNASKTASMNLTSNFTVTGTLSITGNSAINRLLWGTATFGTAQTITCNGTVTADAVDFQDITGSGTASWNLSAAPNFTGDALGNTGITFTTSAAQAWQGTSGGNWSDVTKWTSRVPLAQDDVTINRAFSASQTITPDMPRLGRSINWTGSTGAPSWAFGSSLTASFFGSLTLASGMTTTNNNTVFQAAGRGSSTITSNGVSFSTTLTIQSVGGTYTFADTFTIPAGGQQLVLTAGTLTANADMSLSFFQTSGSLTKVLNMGSGTWSLTRTGSGIWWNISGSGVTINAGTSTVDFPQTDSGVTRTFAGGGFTYATVRMISTGTGGLTITGANTIGTLTVTSAAGTSRTLTLPSSTTTTATTLNLTGGGRVVVKSSTGGTAATLTVTSRNVNYVDFQDITVTGAALTGAALGNISGNTNITFQAKFWVGGSATWDGTAGTKWATYSGGAGGQAIPTASDVVVIDRNSGAATVTLSASSVCRALNCNDFAGTVSHPAALTLSIGDATAPSSAITLVFSSLMTYTLGDAATSALSFVSTSATVQRMDFGGKTTGNVTFNGAGGSWQFSSAHTQGASASVTLTQGTLDTNGQTCTWGSFSSSNSNTRTLTLGVSAISILSSATTLWQVSTTTNLTVTANTAVVTFSGNDAGSTSTFRGPINWNGMSIVHSGGGVFSFGDSGATVTLANYTETGQANKTGGVSLNGNLTCTGTFTATANSATNRLFIRSAAEGTQRTITAATVSANGCTFMDIAGAGAGSWNLSGASLFSGDALGNSGITFTTPVAQTFTGGTKNWSDITAWTSRVPLPQDDVTINTGTQITVDMPRIGRSINFTGFTGTWALGAGPTFALFGSLTLASGMTVSGTSADMYLRGRGTHTLTFAGKQLTAPNVFVWAVGGSYTLQDDYVASATTHSLYHNFGTFDANGHNVTVGQFATSGTVGTRTLNMGSGTWTLRYTALVWDPGTTGTLTLNAGTSIIDITDSTSSTKTFAGKGLSYYTLRYKPTGTGGLTVTGANTFVNLDLEAV